MPMRYANDVSAPTRSRDAPTSLSTTRFNSEKAQTGRPGGGFFFLNSHGGPRHTRLPRARQQQCRRKPLEAHIQVGMRQIHQGKGEARSQETKRERMPCANGMPAEPERRNVEPERAETREQPASQP